MNKLSIGILGLGRTGASIGLALRRYMKKGGKHAFEIIGHDSVPSAEKHALKMGAIDRVEHSLTAAAAGRDILIMALPYDEVRLSYKMMASSLRDGVVILDLSPIKRPSLEWAAELLGEDHHVIGVTPVVNPRYLFDNNNSTENAAEDFFDNSTSLITPAAGSAKEAVDLVFNFCSILGSEPRFLDPLEHDTLLTFTAGLPSLMSVALFHMLTQNRAWSDMQRFTNPSFGVWTRPLYDVHPDAMRDEWLANNEVLVRAVDDMIKTLQGIRTLLAEGEKTAVENVVGSASEEYEKWVNHRHNFDWDRENRPEVNVGNTMIGSLLGTKLSNRFFGKKDDEKK
jgi:prephenate dehydrogenase